MEEGLAVFEPLGNLGTCGKFPWKRATEAVWSGAFDQYAASKRKREVSEVDTEFLKEMEGWRLALATNIARRNRQLSLNDLNEAVQLTIDRVVFLRTAEDRGVS